MKKDLQDLFIQNQNSQNQKSSVHAVKRPIPELSPVKIGRGGGSGQ
jgi:hypothetical protein